jgi:hypothetical protein
MEKSTKLAALVYTNVFGPARRELFEDDCLYADGGFTVAR